MTFGERLQELRNAAGLSQSQLATKSDTSIDSLRNWEQDRAMPKIDAASRLAKALGVSLDRLAIDQPTETGRSNEVNEQTKDNVAAIAAADRARRNRKKRAAAAVEQAQAEAFAQTKATKRRRRQPPGK